MDLFTNIFTFKNIGKRKKQEDNFIFFSFNDIENTIFNCAFIFDGHGASKNKESLPDYIIKEKVLYKEINKYFLDKKVNIRTLSTFFIYFDSILEQNIDKKIGTCFSGILLTDKYIYILTLGDTQIRIYDMKGNLFFQTDFHNFNNKIELERYKRNKQDHYIKNGRYKGLLMTRTLGDFDCKELGECSLIPVPEIKKILNNKDFIIMLKTDGMNINNKQLITKYMDSTITNFLENKQFIDNACLIIFNTNYKNFQSKSINNKKIIENKEETNNVLFFSFLTYVYNID
jgi:serine/threonine protein phosphatase PrpC